LDAKTSTPAAGDAAPPATAPNEPPPKPRAPLPVADLLKAAAAMSVPRDLAEHLCQTLPTRAAVEQAMQTYANTGVYTSPDKAFVFNRPAEPKPKEGAK
jgi:hypothetical protein